MSFYGGLSSPYGTHGKSKCVLKNGFGTDYRFGRVNTRLQVIWMSVNEQKN